MRLIIKGAGVQKTPAKKDYTKEPRGEVRGGSYIKRVVTGTDKDGSPQYRYLRTQEEVEAWEKHKESNTKTHEDAKGSKSKKESLKDKVAKERKKEVNLLLKKPGKDKDKAKKALTLKLDASLESIRENDSKLEREYYESKRCCTPKIPDGKSVELPARSFLGFRTRKVDGTWVRDTLDVKFHAGANPARHGYVPLDEIWVEDMSAEDTDAAVLHEVVEVCLMKDGVSYETAHDISAFIESRFRRDGATLTKQYVMSALKAAKKLVGV